MIFFFFFDFTFQSFIWVGVNSPSLGYRCHLFCRKSFLSKIFFIENLFYRKSYLLKIFRLVANWILNNLMPNKFFKKKRAKQKKGVYWKMARKNFTHQYTEPTWCLSLGDFVTLSVTNHQLSWQLPNNYLFIYLFIYYLGSNPFYNTLSALGILRKGFVRHSNPIRILAFLIGFSIMVYFNGVGLLRITYRGTWNLLYKISTLPN